MTAIRASEVKALREQTGAGMMECKRALQESAGDVEAAVAWLRKQGLSKAAKKATRSATEGVIAIQTSQDGAVVGMVEVCCETDFVAKNDQFRTFVDAIVSAVATNDMADSAALLATPLASGEPIEAAQTALTATIGEKIEVGRFVRCTAGSPQQKLATYIHAGDKIGVVVTFDDPANQLTDEAGRDVAMHVAAMNPPYLNREAVPEKTIAQEKDILRSQMGDSKKPPEIVEKILNGRINKFYAEACLTEQVFVKDPQGKRSVTAVLQSVGDQIVLRDMVRFQIGAGSDA
jgi:elongation factor Ts